MRNASSMVLIGLTALAADPAAPPAVTPSKTISLPNVAGRLGPLAFDDERELLYLAATENNTVEVVDLKAAQRVDRYSIRDPRDLLILPRPNVLYVTSGSEGRLKIFDCAAGRSIKTVGALPEANQMRLDAPASRLYVGFGEGGLVMVNVQTGVKTVTIPLPAAPAAFTIEQFGGRIFVNLPSLRQVAVVDRLSREVAAQWPAGDFSGNHALALDETSGRLFVGCRDPSRLVVLDAKTGRAVADLAIAAQVQSLSFDAKNRRLYASCSEGVLEVVEQRDADHYELRPRVPTAPGAGPALFLEESDTLFLAVPRRDRQSAEVRVYQLAPRTGGD